MAKDTQIHVKKELLDPNFAPKPYSAPASTRPSAFIDLSSSDSDSDDDDNARKKRRMAESAVLPVGFLDPLPQPSTEQLPLALPSTAAPAHAVSAAPIAKQFWKAGDYEDAPSGDWGYSNGGMDHVRVHPRFLHSNATSHKWALGAFAELMDNSLDEVCNGATYVNIDMVKSKKDGGKMLLIEDNGGGMDPEKMRHCVSLGYSAKSKMADTIGQYGNGFKTSTMRLGADVIVFSRCRGKNGLRSTQSIGLLSYTFLRSTGKEDIVVPMLDYERSGQDWIKIIRSSVYDWDRNVETILQWSPFSSEDELLRQFNQIQDQGTRIIIYNIWEDDEGLLELDFDTDPHDIQIRGVNRDEKNIDMAKKYPNSKHFLTYRHSLKSYAAILYLRIPPGFRIILRGKDVEHHNIVNDMMMSQEITYRPQPSTTEEIPKNLNMVATVTVGFVKDAKAHIDVQGFNVYHKNRLIKPFWRVWHPPGSDGRGVIGVLEADFVEPAHDKQGFERTTVLSKLEARLIQMQKTYWTTNCHKIGYAPRVNKKVNQREISPDSFPRGSRSKMRNFTSTDKTPVKFGDKGSNSGRLNGKGDVKRTTKQPNRTEQPLSSDEYLSDDDRRNTSRKHNNGSSSKDVFSKDGSHRPSGLRSRKGDEDYTPEMPSRTTRNSKSQENGLNDAGNSPSNSSSSLLDRLKLENLRLKERLKRKEEEVLGDLLNDLNKEKERSQSLEAQLQEAGQKHEELAKEQESLIEIFSEERERRDIEEENLRRSMKCLSIRKHQTRLKSCWRKCEFWRGHATRNRHC
ncbi:protein MICRORCHIDIA 7-like isoform X1 [Salvia hispanica]|uniref:protein MICRORCHIDIA 7-like isoform X1 n=1 Tax=Salvia hispanica TaxID=49212 RepID=UPI002009B9B0|nr:protein MICRORCHIDIA 7-like isoform X1 [Salvia hispanica]